MGIKFQNNIFSLSTANSLYQLKIGEYGFLLHLYYGAKIESQNLSYLVQRQDRGFAANPADAVPDRTFSPDTLPLEYTTFDSGDFRESCLDIVFPDGSMALDLRYLHHKVYKGKEGLKGLPGSKGNKDDVESLEIVLKDKVYPVEVTLKYSVFEKADVITRSVSIQNKLEQPIKLKRVLSACIDFSIPAKRDFITFYGRHTGEQNIERTKVRHGKIRIDSLRGTSSLHHNPFVILCNSEANETSGECYGFSFVYSGNFLAQSELDQIEQLRFVIGIHPQNFCWQLSTGESFEAPEVVMCYSEYGLDTLSNRLHYFTRCHILPHGLDTQPCPILINNWEATYFDFDTPKLIRIAEEAKKMGVELFVLDDGWFGKRNDDTSSLGDWVVNEEKLTTSLKELSNAIHEKNMKFGLWFEPEMVSPNSDLYRAHPDWALQAPNRNPLLSRSQLVLDFSRPEVVDAIELSISKILSDAKIDYVKWDMNRSLAHVWSAHYPAERQGEVRHRYMLGVYDLLNRLTHKFPEILFESCSSGGGRYDLGMLCYTPQIWGSDNTDAIDRLKIQYGASFGFPLRCCGSHVSVCPNHQTGRTVPVSTRAIVAMAGTYGYELDASKLSDDEKAEMKIFSSTFKSLRNTLHNGTFHRLTDFEKDSWYFAWMAVSKDKNDAVLSYIVTSARSNSPTVCIKLRGIDESKCYRINDSNEIYSGRALTCAGFVLPILKGDYPSQSFHFSAIV